MKIILVVLIFFGFQCVSAYAQKDSIALNNRWFGYQDTSLRSIDLPELKNYHRFKLIDWNKENQLVISNFENYQNIFEPKANLKLPKIDFTKENIIGFPYCIYCSTYCDHKRGICHRNACDYSIHWFTQKKEKTNSIEFQIIMLASNTNMIDSLVIQSESELSKLSPEIQNELKDKVDWKKEVIMMKSTFADCNAKFIHHVYLDTISKTVVWKQTQIYGGCRGMNTFFYAIKFTKIPDIQTYKMKLIND